MNAMEIIDIIDYDLQKYFNTIMINGTWGIGKTHYIKKALENKKHIYVSLFGKDTIDDLKNEVYYNITNNKLIDLGNKIYDKAQRNIQINIPIVAFSLPKKEKKLQEKIRKNFDSDNTPITIIFDDLERKGTNFQIELVLGFIEELSNIDNIKIILVANENEILNKNTVLEDREKQIYISFKEKVIQKTFNISEYSNDVPNNIYNIDSITPLKNVFSRESFSELILNFLDRHKLKNIRTMQKTIPFLKEVFDKIDLALLKDEDISEIIIASLSIVVENTELLYINKAVNEAKKNELFKESYLSLEGRVMKYYFNINPIMSSRMDLITYLNRVFNDEKKDYNFNNIDNYYKTKYSKNVTNNDNNKDLFFYSEEELVNYINNFILSSLKRTNNDFNIQTFLKQIDSILEYTNALEISYLIKDNLVENRLKDYLQNFDYSKSYFDLHYSLDIHFIKNSKTKEYIKKAKIILEEMYYKRLFLKLKDCIDSQTYSYKELDKLERYFGTVDISNNKIYKNIKNELRGNNYFMINVNDGLTEDSWAWMHQIFKIFCSLNEGHGQIKKKFIECVKNELNNSNLLGKFRLNSLIEQYNMER